MAQIVTVPERKSREAARRRSVASEVISEARKFAAGRGGRFYIFGSVAQNCVRHYSDFDIVVDFPD